MNKIYKKINKDSFNWKQELQDYEAFKNQMSFIGISKRDGFKIEHYTNYMYEWYYKYKDNQLIEVTAYYK